MNDFSYSATRRQKKKDRQIILAIRLEDHLLLNLQTQGLSNYYWTKKGSETRYKVIFKANSSKFKLHM